MLQFGLEPMACDAFYVTVFKSLHFHQSTLEKERFQTSPLLKPFSKVFVFIGVLVWMKSENVSESIRFQTKTRLCERGLRVWPPLFKERITLSNGKIVIQRIKCISWSTFYRLDNVIPSLNNGGRSEIWKGKSYILV